MSGTLPVTAPITRPDGAPVIEIVVPVYNEEDQLVASVERLRRYLDAEFPFPAAITIADNASTDGTWALACELAETPGVAALHLDEKGRGRALRAAWSASRARIVAYMDVDLATDLGALLPLVAPLLSGHSDIAVGTRLAASSRVVRGAKREFLSRAYNLVVHAAVGSHVSDVQCGFKALRSETARALLPLVHDDAWFFDTELLVVAERNGLRIHEVPVDWVDDADSRVQLWRTAVDDLKGLARIWRAHPRLEAGAHGQPRAPRNAVLARFVGVGLLSTLAYLVLYLLARPSLGIYGANAVALVVCTIVNTFAHGRFTFAEDGSLDLRTGMIAGCILFTTTLGLTSAALAVVSVLAPGSVPAEVAGLVIAMMGAALVRFVLLRSWIVHLNRHPSSASVVCDPRSFVAERRALP
jgi:putative flippase GtrA